MKFLIVFFLFVTQSIFSQSTTQRYFYELKNESTSNLNRASSKLYVLDVNDTSVKFYKNDFLISDSLYTIHKDPGKVQNVMYRTDFAVIKNKSENAFIELKSFDLLDFYLVKEEAIKQDWKIEKEKKNENGFSLQKATLNYKGRNWIAWFNSEIPLPYGPYKFQGLPGLIFELYDSENIYHFSLIKSQKLDSVFDTTNFLENDFDTKRRIIDEKQYSKILKEYIKDPLKNVQEPNVIDFQYMKEEINNLKKWLEKDNIEILNILEKK
ncbi:GLPGLI family protein [Empedobacter falsenii]|uniref:GLPGLI family protein n=1 Tax=Empedobacter falsenii TaxID=343874 RepID=UPI0025749706|nr:GLPGLI family protein [Empedobacter falsenii]MDM1299674.1 GLPGLI family protein [Empedobacter falsenii]MDM1319467.1 GLPGLI family protein [Empedobacter falsenii]